jgi:hypothetical protein
MVLSIPWNANSILLEFTGAVNLNECPELEDRFFRTFTVTFLGNLNETVGNLIEAKARKRVFVDLMKQPIFLGTLTLS